MMEPESQKTITYLAYLEEMATMFPDAAVEAPGLGPLWPRPEILEGKFVRARFSGIRASLFDRMKEVVGLARDGVLSADQRHERRAALQAAFQRFPIPVIDLFWSSQDAAARRRRVRTMRLHHWFQLELLPGGARGAREPVFMGEPDSDRPAEPEFEAGRLVHLRALSAQEEVPLRDIFSLAHVPDADFEDGTEGPTSAPPPDDDGGPGSDGVPTTSKGAEQLAETVRERVPSVYSGHGSTDRDDQQYLTIGR